jgi:hypothetical protein
MFAVRFHGRGGQGVVTAAELLTAASAPQSAPAGRSPWCLRKPELRRQSRMPGAVSAPGIRLPVVKRGRRGGR